jgi:hypothetical protein
LADRVRARVAEVGLTLDRPASRARIKRARQKRVASAGSPTSHTADQMRESRSLARVFNELAGTHRQHRQRTGQHASPALRDAAQAFKASPSLPLLVVVAAFLEEDGLLAW